MNSQELEFSHSTINQEIAREGTIAENVDETMTAEQRESIDPLVSVSQVPLKKRMRQCANNYCGNKDKYSNNYAGWSRRKLKGINQQMWLCNLCSDAFTKGQYCTHCC